MSIQETKLNTGIESSQTTTRIIHLQKNEGFALKNLVPKGDRLVITNHISQEELDDLKSKYKLNKDKIKDLEKQAETEEISEDDKLLLLNFINFKHNIIRIKEKKDLKDSKEASNIDFTFSITRQENKYKIEILELDGRDDLSKKAGFVKAGKTEVGSDSILETGEFSIVISPNTISQRKLITFKIINDDDYGLVMIYIEGLESGILVNDGKSLRRVYSCQQEKENSDNKDDGSTHKPTIQVETAEERKKREKKEAREKENKKRLVRLEQVNASFGYKNEQLKKDKKVKIFE